MLRDSKGRFTSVGKAKVESGQAVVDALIILSARLCSARADARHVIAAIEADVCFDDEANSIRDILAALNLLLGPSVRTLSNFESYVKSRKVFM